jgi:hypothetical protein
MCLQARGYGKARAGIGPEIKATELRMILAMGAKNRAFMMKSYTKQAFLNGEIGTAVLYIRPPEWWPEPVPEGYLLQLMKSMYGTRQPVRQFDVRISTWFEDRRYFAVNSEKTIFMLDPPRAVCGQHDPRGHKRGVEAGVHSR